MKISRLYIPLVFACLASPALAGEPPQRVLELFTSQGCSSCPPANAFAGKMAQDDGTLVLSYGVTYWDYLGWKDTFASPEFTKRQRKYGRAFESANVYTPQMIINGSAHGSHYSKHDVRSMDLPPRQAGITLHAPRGELEIEFKTETQSIHYKAVVVEYVPGPQSVPVRRGENGGRVLTVTNVVTNVTPLQSIKPAGILKTGVRPRAGKAYSVLLHDPDTMKIKAAATYKP